jgi:hypothetical protein
MGPKNPILRIPEQHRGTEDGMPFSAFKETINGRTYSDHIGETYIPIGGEHLERSRVLNLDPPVLIIDDFIDESTCDGLIAAAVGSGKLERSTIGEGKLGHDGVELSETRTSASLLVDSSAPASRELLVRNLLYSESGGSLSKHHSFLASSQVGY